jgi:hypothetical protein
VHVSSGLRQPVLVMHKRPLEASKGFLHKRGTSLDPSCNCDSLGPTAMVRGQIESQNPHGIYVFRVGRKIDCGTIGYLNLLSCALAGVADGLKDCALVVLGSYFGSLGRDKSANLAFAPLETDQRSASGLEIPLNPWGRGAGG